MEELCIKAFEEIKGYNFSNEYIMKNDTIFEIKKSLDRGDHGLKQLTRE